MVRVLLAAVLAGLFAAPPAATWANDLTIGLGSSRDAASAQETAALRLPPVPYIETMPWLSSGVVLRGPKVDLLIGPTPEMLGAVVVGPPLPPLQSFSQGTTWRWQADQRRGSEAEK